MHREKKEITGMWRFLKKESRKFGRAFRHATFIYTILIGNGILLAATTVVFLFERNVNPHMTNYFEALWWGVTTITTVGFGDTVPITVPGRIIGMALMYTGTVLFITFTGMLVTFWLHEEVEREIEPLEAEVKKEELETERIEVLLKDIRDRLERIESKRH